MANPVHYKRLVLRIAMHALCRPQERRENTAPQEGTTFQSHGVNVFPRSVTRSLGPGNLFEDGLAPTSIIPASGRSPQA